MAETAFIAAAVFGGFFVLSISAAANTPTNSSGVIAGGALVAALAALVAGVVFWIMGV